jgi:hypothetical protein
MANPCVCTLSCVLPAGLQPSPPPPLALCRPRHEAKDLGTKPSPQPPPARALARRPHLAHAPSPCWTLACPLPCIGATPCAAPASPCSVHPFPPSLNVGTLSCSTKWRWEGRDGPRSGPVASPAARAEAWLQRGRGGERERRMRKAGNAVAMEDAGVPQAAQPGRARTRCPPARAVVGGRLVAAHPRPRLRPARTRQRPRRARGGRGAALRGRGDGGRRGPGPPRACSGACAGASPGPTRAPQSSPSFFSNVKGANG